MNNGVKTILGIGMEKGSFHYSISNIFFFFSISYIPLMLKKIAYSCITRMVFGIFVQTNIPMIH